MTYDWLKSMASEFKSGVYFLTWYISVAVHYDLTGRKGGELASAVHAYTKTGDPYMRSLVQHILGLVSHPVLNFLYRWIYDGELEDTYHEVMYVMQ